MKAIDIFLSLEGTWNFKRTLLGRNPTVSLGTLTGSASFTPAQEFVLHYKEDGVMTQPSGETWQAFKEYFYLYHKETDTLEKYFSEKEQIGTLFYRLTLAGENFTASRNVATGNHLCLNDLYLGEYIFDFDPDAKNFSRFKLKYDVTGPRKNYESMTVFERKVE